MVSHEWLAIIQNLRRQKSSEKTQPKYKLATKVSYLTVFKPFPEQNTKRFDVCCSNLTMFDI